MDEWEYLERQDKELSHPFKCKASIKRKMWEICVRRFGNAQQRLKR